MVSWLDDEIQRIHLVALDGELRHVGDENQHGIGVDFAHDARHFQPVQLIHADIHKHDVVVLGAADEIQRAVEDVNHIRLTVLLEVGIDKRLERAGIAAFIIDDGN